MPVDAPLHVASRAGTLWIGSDDSPSSQVELHLKGVSWSGSQRKGCVHELYKHKAQDYIDFLVAHDFNAVRLPLSVPLVNHDEVVSRGQGCGEFSGLRHLQIVDLVIARLAAVGILVSLCMHTSSSPSRNEGLWCTEDECDERAEEPLRLAWTTLAHRHTPPVSTHFCPHVHIFSRNAWRQLLSTRRPKTIERGRQARSNQCGHSHGPTIPSRTDIAAQIM